MSPQLPLEIQSSPHWLCGGTFAQLMPNWPQKSSPHICALSQALLHESTTPVDDEAATPVDATEDTADDIGPELTDDATVTDPGPVPTDTETSIVAPVEL